MLSRSEVAAEERLHELRDELPEVRVQPVNVLRPFPLGEVALGPGKVEVEIAVERVLCRSHGLAVFGGHDATPGPTGEDRRRARCRRAVRLRTRRQPVGAGTLDLRAATLAPLAEGARASTRPRRRADRRSPALPSASPRRRRAAARAARSGRARRRRRGRFAPGSGSRAAGSARRRVARQLGLAPRC